MKALLMYRDRDFDVQQPMPPNADDLVQDLGLNELFSAMASGDRLILEVARSAVLNSLYDVDAIVYRQNVLRDALANPQVVRNLYALAGKAIESESRNFWGLRIRHAASILRRAKDVLWMFLDSLRELRSIAQDHGKAFESEGFSRLFAMLEDQLDDQYLMRLRDHLQQVEFPGGILMSARLGGGNHGTDYVLRERNDPSRSWFERLFPARDAGYTYEVHPRDESGARALSELGDRGVNLVADALAQSADHILGFFTMLRTEIAFYVGCINVRDRLVAMGQPICLPDVSEAGTGVRRCEDMYDPVLALSVAGPVVGNDCDASGKATIVITGANQGGKSTFLRGIGLSQLMLQCGVFVPAASYAASLCSGIFTHYKREEDDTMQSGKLDEELRRMTVLADRLRPNALVLFNESFAATNDREGSEIAYQIVSALADSNVQVAFVTHLYEFAHRIFDERAEQSIFLLAQRREDGRRTFKLLEGEPLPTSYGEDIYGRVFANRG